MNARRKSSVVKIIDDLEKIQQKLFLIESEEQSAVDNTPESLQDTDRYYHAEECIEILSDAQSDIDNIIESLKEV